ncbi:MAG: hypothetical protein ACI837_003497 [Crocinitomicaceae bacterium]|jgi:hypothetical protein
MRHFKIAAVLICLIGGAFAVHAQDDMKAQDAKKVALTTFWVSKHIGFEELGGIGVAAAVASLSEDPNFNLQPVLDNFYKTFTEVYAKEFPFDLLPEDDVLTNEDYMAYEGRFDEANDEDRSKLFQRFLTPKTYTPLRESLFKGEKSNQMQMVEMFKTEADGIMFVSMGYDFVKKPLPFTAGIRAFVRIKIWNKEGKRVLSINEYGTSKKTVAIVAGIPIMDVDKLLPLCESASEKLVKDLEKRIGKVAKKCAKKL